MATTPRGRKKNVSGEGKDIYKRGEGLGTGPVGSSEGYSGRPQGPGGSEEDRAGLADLFFNAVSTDTSQSQNSSQQGGGLSGLFGGSSQSGSSSSSGSGLGGLFKGKGLIIIVLLLLLLGGGGGLSGLFGNLFGGGTASQGNNNNNTIVTQPHNNTGSNTATPFSSLGGLSSIFGGSNNAYSFSGSGTSSGWGISANTAKLNTEVDPQARAKRTTILGNRKDVFTLMIYMCGTDLESQYGMASSDLKEMVSASLNDNVNLIVMTGGCRQWRVNGISNSVNQIWQVKDGKLHQLEANAGNAAMTDPNTLSSFIQFCKANFPANRNALIFWDHGGGTLSGYGHDERVSGSGSMNLSGIQTALKNGGMTFDFIGFDTCLMATAETALMLSDYADYMVASEETEPGIGWFYTNWLSALSANTSMPTIEIGKNIVDDFVDTCARNCAGQKATLSLVDLAELEKTLPADLKEFATTTSSQIKSDYKVVSKARSATREFGASNRIDQIDLVDLANKIGSKEADELARTLLSAIKYNRTSSDMTNAYGLSMYFPYQRVGKVNTAIQTYQAIGMDEEYLRCIRDFASVETGGQAVSGGAASPLGSLLSNYTGGGQSASSQDMVSSILGGLLGGNYNNVSGLSGLAGSFLGGSFGRSLDVDETAEYLWKNRFDKDQLKTWTLFEDGKYGIHLKDEQWDLVQKLELNLFVDDGEGYIDMGLDNVFSINQYGVLSGEYDYTWLAINQQPVPYYLMHTEDDGTNYSITGRVPVLLNGKRAELILVFDNQNEDGYVAGARLIYDDQETETVAKGVTELAAEDTIDFICDYYDYQGNYQDSYLMGEQIRVGDGLTISDVTVNKAKAQAAYRFTDIYNQQYWTPVLP